MSWFGISRKNRGDGRETGGGRSDSALPPDTEMPRFLLEPRIWAVGGGKGGVGKSLVAVNLGILLSRAGNNVLMIDADLGAANLHTFLGVEGSNMPLSSFLRSDVLDIRSVISKTGIPNLDIVSGARDSLDTADLGSRQLSRLKGALSTVGYDYVLLDLGPGTSTNMLDLFLAATEGVLVTTPEPTSVENTYRFIKCVLMRRIRVIAASGENSKLKAALHKVFEGDWSGKIKHVVDIMTQLRRIDQSSGDTLKELLGKTSISLILNQAKRPGDKDVGVSMKMACERYFGIEVGLLGSIGYDDSAADSVRRRRPLVVHYRDSAASMAVEAGFQNLMRREQGTRMREASFRG
ncbi:MAG: P-loop NTPase [Deltaproteobacteria bacterium]|nr:P-loop NTPase [Deltaproteobacteria bacterium]